MKKRKFLKTLSLHSKKPRSIFKKQNTSLYINIRIEILGLLFCFFKTRKRRMYSYANNKFFNK